MDSRIEVLLTLFSPPAVRMPVSYSIGYFEALKLMLVYGLYWPAVRATYGVHAIRATGGELSEERHPIVDIGERPARVALLAISPVSAISNFTDSPAV